MAAGRPQEWDVDYIIQELAIWARLPDSLNINAFCTSLNPEIDPEYLRQISKKNPELSRTLRIAKAYLATRREEANTEKMLGDKGYAANIKHYDIFLKMDDKEEDLETEERDFKRKLALIDHQTKQEQAKLISPYESTHDLKHENMILSDKIRKLEALLADKS